MEESINNERAEDEMDVSDEESAADLSPRKRIRNESIVEERHHLKEENDSLRCQLEAYKNEVDLVRTDLKIELENKEKQCKILHQTLQGMQQQLIDSKRKQYEEECKVKELEKKIEKISNDKVESCLDSTSTIVDLDDDSNVETTNNSITITSISEREAKLIGIISTFLNVHPFGAGLDYLWSYVTKLESNLKPSDLEVLMSRFPTVFKQELSGIGANMERRWQFNAYVSQSYD